MKINICRFFATLASLFVAAIAIPVLAQNVNIYSTQARKVIDKALTTIEDYETLASVSDEEAYYAFQDLFTSPELRIVNDTKQSDFNGGFTKTVNQYADFLYKNARNKMVFVSEVKRENIWKEGDVIKVQYSFNKSLKFVDNCGVIYPKNPDFINYRMIATLVYDEQQDVCKIEKLVKSNTTSVSSSEDNDDGYTFMGSGSLDKQLRYNNKLLSLNSYYQASLPAPINMSSFYFSDPDVIATPSIDEDCKTVTVDYKVRRFAVKAHYDMGLGDGLTLDEKDTYKSCKTKSNSMGVDFGYFFPSKSNFKFGVFAGLNLTQSSIKLDYANDDYCFKTDADVDGESYYRHYKNLSIRQSVKLSEFTIPLYCDISTRLGKMVSLYADLGLKFNFSMSHKISEAEGSAYVYGIYPQHADLLMDEHWGYDGFGNSTFSSSELTDEAMSNVSGFTTDLYGALGLRFYIPSSPLAIDLGVSYTSGFGSVLKTPENIVKYDDIDNPSNAVVYNTVSGIESTEHVRNLIDSQKEIKHNNLRLNIGLMFKF